MRLSSSKLFPVKIPGTKHGQEKNSFFIVKELKKKSMK